MAILALVAASQALAPASRIIMLVRSAHGPKTFEVRSVIYDHTKVARMRPRSPEPVEPADITVVLPASPAAQTILKANSKLQKVDLVSYTLDAAGHQRLRSQVEIGNATVTEYTPSEDKKTVTVKLSSKLVYVTEQSLSADTDWAAKP